MTVHAGRRLAVRLPPVGPEECLRGYALRLAEANGYPNARWLVSRGRPEDCMDEEFVSLVSNVRSPGAGASFAVQLASVSPAHLDLDKPRVCGKCLAEAAWIRAVWALCSYVACPVHGTLLIDECPGCRAPLSWNRPGPATCGCGYDLRDGEGAPASAALVRCAALLGSLASGMPPGPGVAPIADLNAAAALLRFFSSAFAESGAGWRCRFMSKPRVHQFAAELEAAVPVLLDWPRALHEWLSREAAEPRREGTGLRACFGDVLHRSLNPLGCEGLGAVADEIRRWLAEEWCGGKLKRSSPL